MELKEYIKICIESFNSDEAAERIANYIEEYHQAKLKERKVWDELEKAGLDEPFGSNKLCKHKNMFSNAFDRWCGDCGFRIKIK